MNAAEYQAKYLQSGARAGNLNGMWRYARMKRNGKHSRRRMRGTLANVHHVLSHGRSS